MKTTKQLMSTKTMTLGAVLTATVIVFQLLATGTAIFGPFTTAIALVPIAIGAVLCGPWIGAWLGFIFALVVLLTGGANLFFMFNIPGTIITVILKGMACGIASGFAYKALKRVNETLAIIVASVICPCANTATFLLGCVIFFYPKSAQIAEAAGMSGSGFAIFWAMAIANFVFELAMCAVLSPVIAKLIKIRKNQAK